MRKDPFQIQAGGLRSGLAYDQDWHEAGNGRQALYTNVPPRHYRFRVIASNNSGLWNQSGDTLEFSIAPSYYQTKWFSASCVARPDNARHHSADWSSATRPRSNP